MILRAYPAAHHMLVTHMHGDFCLGGNRLGNGHGIWLTDLHDRAPLTAPHPSQPCAGSDACLSALAGLHRSLDLGGEVRAIQRAVCLAQALPSSACPPGSSPVSL